MFIFPKLQICFSVYYERFGESNFKIRKEILLIKYTNNLEIKPSWILIFNILHVHNLMQNTQNRCFVLIFRILQGPEKLTTFWLPFKKLSRRRNTISFLPVSTGQSVECQGIFMDVPSQSIVKIAPKRALNCIE